MTLEKLFCLASRILEKTVSFAGGNPMTPRSENIFSHLHIEVTAGSFTEFIKLPSRKKASVDRWDAYEFYELFLKKYGKTAFL